MHVHGFSMASQVNKLENTIVNLIAHGWLWNGRQPAVLKKIGKGCYNFLFQEPAVESSKSCSCDVQLVSWL